MKLNWPPHGVVKCECKDKKTLKDYMEIKAEDTISKNLDNNYPKEGKEER